MHTRYESSYPYSMRSYVGGRRHSYYHRWSKIEKHGAESVVGYRCGRFVMGAVWLTEAHCNRQKSHVICLVLTNITCIRQT